MDGSTKVCCECNQPTADYYTRHVPGMIGKQAVCAVCQPLLVQREIREDFREPTPDRVIQQF